MVTGANPAASTDEIGPLADGSLAAALPPAGPGAYVLALRLAAPLTIMIGGRAAGGLAPGLYLYAGSARGPGGIRARVLRHLRRGKRRHWHVDQLTEAASEFAVLPVIGGDECALMRDILALPGTHLPIAGFGSSDCAQCAAHLAAIPETGSLAAALAALAGGGTGLARPEDIWMPTLESAAEPEQA